MSETTPFFFPLKQQSFISLSAKKSENFRIAKLNLLYHISPILFFFLQKPLSL